MDFTFVKLCPVSVVPIFCAAKSNLRNPFNQIHRQVEKEICDQTSAPISAININNPNLPFIRKLAYENLQHLHVLSHHRIICMCAKIK